MMNPKAVRITNILSAAMLLLNLGCVFLNMLLSLLANRLWISLPAGLFLYLALLLPEIVLLIYGIQCAKRKQGVFDLISSIATLLVSIVWAPVGLLQWCMSVMQNVILEYYYRMDIAMSLGEFLTVINYATIAHMIFTTLVAVYLLIVFIISVLRSRNKLLQIKAELHRAVIAVILLVPNFLSFVRMILNRILMNRIEMGLMNLDAYSTYTSVVTLILVGVQVLLVVAAIVLLLTFGLIFKKQVEPQNAPQKTTQPSHLPFDLPTGVSADDL